MGTPCKDQKILKEATFKKWQEKFPWLKILSKSQPKKMICEICTNQENGSKNFTMSTLAEHRSTDSHQCASEAKENEQATIAGKSIPMCKITFKSAC